MKKFPITYAICGLFLFLIIGCGENISYPPEITIDPPPEITIDSLFFGTDSTFEIITWNLQNFPKNGEVTIDYVVEIILKLDVDIVALQEIAHTSELNNLATQLPDWEAFIPYFYNSDYEDYYNPPVGYLIKNTALSVQNINEIYTTEQYWRPFPRSPMVMDIVYNNENFIIINNHLKCCGDEIMDPNDPWDEETRRYDACILLEEYIQNYHSDKNVILLGDLNDSLTDIEANNVFQVFLDEPENYKFADMTIAEGNISNYSYPSWPSHIDHILITNELFDDFENENSEIQTIKIDEYLDGGWSEYYDNISDHRPVGIKLKLGE